jgi:hypothetical protein
MSEQVEIVNGDGEPFGFNEIQSVPMAAVEDLGAMALKSNSSKALDDRTISELPL